MKITITLEGRDGHVKITSKPSIDEIAKIARGEKENSAPEIIYAHRALSQMMKLSMEISQAQGLLPAGRVQTKGPLDIIKPGHA